jgi:hypothetical protein
MSSPAPRGALGESGGNKSAGNVEESSRAPGGPDLSARKAGRRPHRIVLRALKSLPPVSLRQVRSFHAVS